MLASSSRLGLGWLARRASPWSWHMHAAGVAAHHPREHGHGGMGRHDRERGEGGPERRSRKACSEPVVCTAHGRDRTRPLLTSVVVRTRRMKRRRGAPLPHVASCSGTAPSPGLASYSRPTNPTTPFPRNPNGLGDGEWRPVVPLPPDSPKPKGPRALRRRSRAIHTRRGPGQTRIARAEGSETHTHHPTNRDSLTC